MDTAKNIILMVIIIGFSYKAKAVDNIQFVLKENKIDSTFKFGKWTEEGGYEHHYKYLGQVNSTNGRTFKILTSIWIWGLSRRATSRIYIYNEKNQYIGNYYANMINSLPDKLENGKLIFLNYSDKYCKSTRKAYDLTKGLPKEIYAKCDTMLFQD